MLINGWAMEKELTETKELLEEHNDLKKLFRHVELIKKQWERTVDCIGDIILLVDVNGYVIRCNKAAIDFAGMTYNEIIGRKWGELLDSNGIKTPAYEQGAELFHELSGRWFIFNSYPFIDPANPEITGMVITLHDATHLKLITVELESKSRQIDESRMKWQRATVEFSKLVRLVTHQKQLSLRFENPNLANCWEVRGCSKKECVAHGKKAFRCWQVSNTACGNGHENFPEKLKHCVKCGVYKMATADPIYEIGENFNDMMVILEQKNNELENANTELKAKQSQILQQEKMASIGNLAAGVAHEINNPMGFISSNLNTLDKYHDRLISFVNAQSSSSEGGGASADEVRQLRSSLKIDYILGDLKDVVKESLEGADRVRRIVQDLKSFSRVDEAEVKFADINQCLESTINIVWNEIKYKASVTKEYGDMPAVRCYPQQLNQVFMNLLVNAAQAIEERGEIKVRSFTEGGSACVSVSDTGCGIPEGHLKRIFEPFFTTKEVGKGTGLGLSIAYDIVKKHNGELRVESEVGKGTTFTLIIPITGK